MSFDSNNDRKNSINKMRGIMGIAMGVIYLLMAVLVVYLQKIGYFQIGNIFSYAVAALMLAYGVFRIYRGYKMMSGGW